MKVALFVFSLLSLSNPSYGASIPSIQPKVIYGDDNRKNLYEVQNSKLVDIAHSTAAIFDEGDVKKNRITGCYKLKTTTYGKLMELCKDEPFYHEPSGAYCSAFLVGPDLMVTAGHCIVDEDNCKSSRFVFGFWKDRKHGNPKTVKKNNVYSCKKILTRQQEGEGADFALIKLDRPVVGRAPLEMDESGVYIPGTPITVIGYPSGIPVKVADGAKIRSNHNGYFVANLDTYGGNSGSAVIDSETSKVIGILVRGEMDFVSNGQCTRSNRCEDGGCRGEDSTHIVEVIKAIRAIQ